MNVLDLISKIGEKETQTLKKVFISPVFSNTVVATHIDGMVYSFTIPKVAGGWYQIQPADTKYELGGYCHGQILGGRD